MTISNKDTSEIPSGNGLYSATVTLTKAEVTDNPNVLIHSITIFNPDADDGYLLVYDADSANVTVGTTTPNFIVGVGTKGTAHINFDKPLRFDTGFTVAAADAVAGTGAHNLQTVITYESLA